MVRYCREGDPPFAAHGYKIKIGELGADTFREEAATFIGAVEAGEEPRNRGKAFMARLNAAT
jgi:hypothetical protein